MLSRTPVTGLLVAIYLDLAVNAARSCFEMGRVQTPVDDVNDSLAAAATAMCDVGASLVACAVAFAMESAMEGTERMDDADIERVCTLAFGAVGNRALAVDCDCGAPHAHIAVLGAEEAAGIIRTWSATSGR